MVEKSLTAGHRIDGRFTLKSELGNGGFGAVWRASDDANAGVDVALKILHQRHRKDRNVLARFVREAEILSTLEHPGIAKSVAWSVEGAEAYLALEFIDGSSLDKHLAAQALRGQYFPPEALIRIVRELSDAVGHAHANGVVHRDLKPQNVMVLPGKVERAIKVLDFGVAKILQGDKSDATTSGRMFGTLSYLAPEQVDASLVDHRADIFAIGVLLFELLTLRRPWVRDESDRPVPALEAKKWFAVSQNRDTDMIERIKRGRRPRPSESRPELPPAVDEVVLRALAHYREERYATVDALAKAFLAAIQGKPLPPEHSAESLTISGSPVSSLLVPPPDTAMEQGPEPVFTATHVMPQALDVQGRTGLWTRDAGTAVLTEAGPTSRTAAPRTAVDAPATAVGGPPTAVGTGQGGARGGASAVAGFATAAGTGQGAASAGRGATAGLRAEPAPTTSAMSPAQLTPPIALGPAVAPPTTRAQAPAQGRAARRATIAALLAALAAVPAVVLVLGERDQVTIVGAEVPAGDPPRAPDPTTAPGATAPAAGPGAAAAPGEAGAGVGAGVVAAPGEAGAGVGAGVVAAPGGSAAAPGETGAAAPRGGSAAVPEGAASAAARAEEAATSTPAHPQPKPLQKKRERARSRHAETAPPPAAPPARTSEVDRLRAELAGAARGGASASDLVAIGGHIESAAEKSLDAKAARTVRRCVAQSRSVATPARGVQVLEGCLGTFAAALGDSAR